MVTRVVWRGLLLAVLGAILFGACDDSRPLVSDIPHEDAGDAGDGAPCDAAGQAGACAAP